VTHISGTEDPWLEITATLRNGPLTREVIAKEENALTLPLPWTDRVSHTEPIVKGLRSWRS